MTGGAQESCSDRRRNGLQAWHVAATAFAVTCGGPFGVEGCVRSFGGAWSMAGFFLACVFGTLPEIAMIAELSLMLPVSNGGVAAWVDRAFGPGAAAIVALNMVVYQVVDLAIYPTLVADYVHAADPAGGAWVAALAAACVVVLGCAVNLSSSELATSFYAAVLALILVPFAVGLALSWHAWPYAARVTEGLESPLVGGSGAGGPSSLSLFVSTMVWLNTGWDATSSLAAEVASPPAFVWGLGAAAFACPAVYAACTFGAFAAGPGAWGDGYLAEAYGRVWRPLSLTIVVMGTASNFVLYASELGCLARLLQAVADPALGLRLLPGCLAARSPSSGAPVMALAVVSGVELVLVLGCGFEYLVQVSTLLHIFVFWLSLAAYAKLRLGRARSEQTTGWELPGGRASTIAVVCVRAPLLFFVLLCTCAVPSVALGAFSANALFLLVVAAWRWASGRSVDAALTSEALRTAMAAE